MKRNWIIYGSLMGLLMIVMEITHYRVTVRDIGIELYGTIIGLVFLGLGLWLGAKWFKKKSTPDRYDQQRLGLSNRELEVLELMSQGYSNQEIADKIFVSLNTVKTHISKVYQKMGVQRRTQAVQKAREMALIQIEES